ncbi:hypothetical protein [Lentzea sp. NPDC059081]|uniref:hypothetical protein n=1 Tax=Lentzea sp. NPDC059081 TaxID=3346719 RepID=UPI00367A1D9D
MISQRAAHLIPAVHPKTPEWAERTINLDRAGELLAHIAEIGRVPLLADGTDHLVVRVVQRLHAGLGEESIVFVPSVAAVDVRRVNDAKNAEPGLMTAKRAAELAALLVTAAELAAQVGSGR